MSYAAHSIMSTSSPILDNSDDDSDVLPSFDLVEIDDSAAKSRAERILKSRQAATTYKAKFEEPGVSATLLSLQ